MNSPVLSSDDVPLAGTATNAVRLAILFLLLYFCFLIIRPFIPLVLWGAIIAVAIYPLHTKFTAKPTPRLVPTAFIVSMAAIAAAGPVRKRRTSVPLGESGCDRSLIAVTDSSQPSP